MKPSTKCRYASKFAFLAILAEIEKTEKKIHAERHIEFPKKIAKISKKTPKCRPPEKNLR